MWSRPHAGWKAGARVDPGARTLRLSCWPTGARTPEEVAWKTTVCARWPCCPPRTPTCCRPAPSGAGYRLANPARLTAGDVPALLDGADVVVVRLLGGRQAWEDGLDAVRRPACPAVVLGGEQAPDAELMELSTVAGRDRRRGARVPGARRAGEPAAAGPVPVGRDHADRRGLRAARRHARLGQCSTGPQTRHRARQHPARSSRSCTTGPITWRETPASCTRSPTR